MSEDARNFSRAIKSVQEELEAVDWYNQRAAADEDEQLKRSSNTTATKRSSTPCMALEWLRRNNREVRRALKTISYVWRHLEIEKQAESQTMIDLRSDTVTKPSDKMRAAMASAEVGDDVFGDDPTVNGFRKSRQRSLKRGRFFVPSGCMGNEIAVKVHTSPARRSSPRNAATS